MLIVFLFVNANNSGFIRLWCVSGGLYLRLRDFHVLPAETQPMEQTYSHTETCFHSVRETLITMDFNMNMDMDLNRSNHRPEQSFLFMYIYTEDGHCWLC